jgi:ABC-type multidrug transport system fused ATPase/permease subunit
MSNALRETKRLIVAYKKHLALGAFLMVINRLAGFALPALSKYIIDDIVIKGRSGLITIVAIVAGASILLQAATSFLLSKTLGVAATYAISEMRMRVQAHVERLPIRYFDSMQTGRLISRIMSDAEGVRTLVGNGLIQLCGSVITAILSIGVLFYLNWRLTTFTVVVLLAFGGSITFAFTRLRPLFRERAEIYSRITGRLAESLGGIRIVKAYTAEKREELVFARGAHNLLRNVKKSIVGVSATSAFTSVIVGAIGVIIMIAGGKSVLSGEMTLGDLFMYIFIAGFLAVPLIDISNIGTQITEAFAGLDRIREILNMPTEDECDVTKIATNEIHGEVEFENVWFEYTSGVPVLKNVSFKAQMGSTTALVGPSGSGIYF